MFLPSLWEAIEAVTMIWLVECVFWVMGFFFLFFFAVMDS